MVSDSRDSSPVGPDVVRKVAALARLRLPEEDLSAWTGQLGRILSYIGQLERVPAAASGGPGTRDLSATPMRDDRPEPGGGAAALAANEPDLVHGYGSVPRVVGAS
jgi:aspartyl-tRNA(Asn)/glutamyl-tRNA(Gln) amidotransferase subunit C